MPNAWSEQGVSATSLFPIRRVRSLEILSTDELNVIHLASLDLLENLGVKVFSNEALKILDESGANVDYSKQTAKIPQHLVDEALKKCPKTIRLSARNQELDVVLDGRHIFGTTDGTGLATIDLDTGERRQPTKDDVRRTALMVDALDHINMYYPTVTPLDCPGHAHVLHEYEAALNNTEKHFISGATYLPEEADFLLQMASTLVGGKEELMKQPIISAVACMMSPLIIPLKETEAALEFAKYHVPVILMTMPLTGATGPITVAGSILVGNAQILGGIVALQMASAGTPIIYSSYPLSMELKTGAFSVAFPEATLVTVGHIRMAKYYGLPSYGGGTVSSSKVPDEQAAYEKSLCALTCMLAGGDVCGTIGLFENYTVLCYEQMLIDYEMYEYMLKIAAGIEVNDETLAIETIYKVGAEGHFLAEKHTLKHANEVWAPMLSDPRPYATWKEAGSKSVVERARDKVREILSSHKPPDLDSGVKRRVHEVVEEGEKRIPH